MKFETLLKSEIMKMKPKRVLNLACGEVLIPNFLSDIDTKFYGIDLESLDERVEICDIDREKLPFKNGFFDLVICINSIEHFRTFSVFREVNRVLKMNGKFIFITPNIRNPLMRLNKTLPFIRDVRGLFYGVNYNYGVYYFMNDIETIRKIAKWFNFNVCRIKLFGFVNGYFLFSKTLSKLVGKLEKVAYKTNPDIQPTIYASFIKSGRVVKFCKKKK